MTTMAGRTASHSEQSFRHEALFYSGESAFIDRTISFINEGIATHEPVLVVVGAGKIEMLRAELGARAPANGVVFADMGEVGHNPACIIPVWREFAAKQAPSGRRFRGIGEPIWAGRTGEELVECERHESLLNLAFADVHGLWLVCPYDTQTLAPSVLNEAERNHPLVFQRGVMSKSTTYVEPLASFDRPLPPPPDRALEMTFDAEQLTDVRDFVSRYTADHALPFPRTDELVLAVDEVASNTLRHAGGFGTLRIWHEGTTMICEVLDGGRIDDPLVGRRRPSIDGESGFGLWLVNQLCDLVQVRNFPTDTVVRLHMLAEGRGSAIPPG